jgi:hypothetical protein
MIKPLILKMVKLLTLRLIENARVCGNGQGLCSLISMPARGHVSRFWPHHFDGTMLNEKFQKGGLNYWPFTGLGVDQFEMTGLREMDQR